MVKSIHSKNDVSSSGYEDNGSDTDEHPKQHSEQAKDISEIVSANTNYKRLQKQNKIIEAQIESDEEVFLLKVPKWVNPTDLINTKFSTSKKSKVKTLSEVYHMKPLSDVAEPKMFVNSFGLKRITPVSILQLEKYVEDKGKDDDITEESSPVPLPKDLTARHSIFGAKYEARIQLQEEIQKKLQQALQRFEEPKKAPKKKKKVIDHDELDDKSLLISQILEEKLQSRKLKKENTSTIESPQIITCDSPSSDIVKQNKKMKKQKNKDVIEKSFEGIKNEIIIHDDHLLEVNDMQDCLATTLDSSSPSKSKKKRKDKKINDNTQLIQSEDGGVEHGATNEKKKKKKHKHLITEETDGFTTTPNDQEQPPLNDTTSNIKVELLSDQDLNETSFSKKKKRKNKLLSLQEETESSEHIKQENQEDSAYNPGSTSPEKKRKKKKQHFSVEVKKEILSESENPDLSVSEKKSKKRRRDSEVTFAAPEIKQEFDDLFLPPAKKRKPSILSSTVIKEGSPEFKPDISAIELEERAPKKKNKQKSIDNQCDIIKDLLSNVKNSLSPKKNLF